MSTSLSPIAQAFATPVSSPSPCGEDPRYLDEFLFIKEEFDKLSDTDYEQVLRLSNQLLTETCKDLRLAAYHLLACVYVNGLAGLQEGLVGYRCILEQFWDDCYPTSESARLAALALLNTPRLTAFAEQHKEEGEASLLETITAEIDQINRFLIDHLGEEVPRLTTLAAWSKKQQALLPVVEEPPAAVPAGAEPSVRPEPDSAPSQIRSNISSSRELDNETRKLHSYLCESGELYRAISLSRAMLWSIASLPPQEQGKTQVPAPRPSAWAELHNLAAANAADQALQLSEKIFFEPGFRFSLALQHFAWQQACAQHRSDLSRLLEITTLSYTERFPELTELCFADGTPFCDPESANWLENLTGQHQRNPNDGVPQPAGFASAQFNDVITAALPLARNKQLVEALAMVREITSESALLKVRRGLAEAQLCLAAGKSQLAGAVLAQLHDSASSGHLDTWHPELVIEIIQLRCKVIQNQLKTAAQEEKSHLLKTQEELFRSACQLDLAAAAQFF